MLKLLHIENIAVIEQCDIEFKKGFNVLTGETGAGKSIIIDSIGAVLGYRTTRDVVRNGAAKASVSAVFEDCTDETYLWLAENGYGDSGDGEVMISREITADGKSSARINGKPITAALLKNFGVLLINILGQHDSQQLLDPEVHPVFIDRFASDDRFVAHKNEYTKVYEELCEKRTERKRLDIDGNAKARQVEMLKFQIEELEEANLRDNEDTELEERRCMIRESAKLTERVSEAYSAFYGDENFPGICSALSTASKVLGSISGISENLALVSNSTSELYYSADDIASKLREMLDSFDFSEEDANTVEARLDILHKLKRKYGNTVSDMIDYLENAKCELAEIEFSDERVQQLDSEIELLEKQARDIADCLFELRREAAAKFEASIMKELAELDMKNARFIAEVERTEQLDSNGADTVRFLLAANLGEVAKPLEKIASGGELSRIMLAMKNALDENDYVNTLIFDEIDSGVSGRAAQRIAEKLYKLSGKKQVLCVTHLAQISAMSDVHFKIEKTEKEGRTFTNVAVLDDRGRAEELARITAGSLIGEATIKNAEEMLEFAKVQKEAIAKQ